MPDKQIHDQAEALSIYLKEVLNETQKPVESLQPDTESSNTPLPVKTVDASVQTANSAIHEVAVKPLEKEHTATPQTQTESTPAISNSVKASLIATVPLTENEPIDKKSLPEDNKLILTSSEPVEASTTEADQTEESADVQTQEKNTQIKLLLCNIGGMEIAVEVEKLDNIIRWPEAGLTQIPNDNSWELGLFNDRGQSANIVDVREILQCPDVSSPVSANFILLLADRQWGIACDQIQQIVSEPTDTINWRQDLTQREWYRGVLNKSMHSIVDLLTIINALK